MIIANINKYDFFIIILVASVAAGAYGGSIQVPRMIGVILIPSLLKNFYRVPNSLIKGPRNFVIFILIWCVCSLFWTVNTSRGVEELVYYFVHFFVFLEIICFSYLAKKTLRSISTGWLLAFVITATIAIWEISTGHHLSTSKFEEGMLQNYGEGIVAIKVFASATFVNYNDFNVMICYCVPFITYLALKTRKRFYLVLCIFLLALAFYIVVVNASRGSTISMLIFGGFCLWGTIRKGRNLRSFSFVLIFLVVFAFVRYADEFFFYLNRRLGVIELFEDRARIDVWSRAFGVFKNTLFLGTGLGGLYEGMQTVSYRGQLIAVHNMFIEALVTFGVIPFFFFLKGFFHLLSVSFFTKERLIRIVLLGTFTALPIFSIVNSTYLLSVDLYIFYASLYVFAKHEYFVV